MPFAALTYDIRPGCEDEVAEVFAGFRRVGSPSVPGAGASPAARLLATAVFVRGATLVRVIEYEGDLEAVARHMAGQPGVQEVERRLKPYLNTPRDTDTVEGFVRTFRQSLLRCVSQIGVPRD
ncbi:SchA/CurD [Streptomyces sp. NBC_01456]|uniref:SchA/CurD-like domain-containing protein n=1 Tax=unclassified Streptomyces TaxID=2593676 RepID=UPI002E363499|nr:MULTISPECIES: SchA/CurD-like domain-containing protein [unclassified Streptomyces]